MIEIFQEDCLDFMSKMGSESVDCIVTSPPYNKTGLTGKGKGVVSGQVWGKYNIDYESYEDDMPEHLYQDWMVSCLNEMHRIISPTGSIFFNHKPRRHNNTCFLPTDFIHRSQVKLYQLIIWDRRNSPNIRSDILVPCTEHIYWLTKTKPKVFRNQLEKEFKGEVWRIPPEKQQGHPAPFPAQLVRNCLLLATERGYTVFDPFLGSGTSATVSKELGRNFIGVDISGVYCGLTESNLAKCQESGV